MHLSALPKRSFDVPLLLWHLQLEGMHQCLVKIIHELISLTVCSPILASQFGVAMASAGELSFNWLGFLTAMASNLTFGFRAVWSKQ